MEFLLALMLLSLCLIDGIHATNCPPILIRTIPMDNQCWPDCPQGQYCKYGQCQICYPCGDPYTMAKQGSTEMSIYAECIDKGSCPNSCENNSFMLKGNITMCFCVDVTPPPPTVPPTIACKVGCKHGGCVENDECNCDDGWSGSLCDECVPDPACQHGHCNETERCMCYLNWDGVNCDQDVSYCATHQPCQNNAPCENDGSGGYTCTCSEGFSGTNCENETSLHHCQRVCPINGTCLEGSAGIYQCHCLPGFMGADCTQPKPESSSSLSSQVYIVLASIVVVIAFVVIVIICRKCRCERKPEGIPGSSSNSGVPLITGKIDYRLEGTKVFLHIKESWRPCWLKTCKCLMEAPLKVTEESETEICVSNLRAGYRYNFEIRKYNARPLDVEESDCIVAECEVSVSCTSATIENEDSNCTAMIGQALNDLALMRSLNQTLEADRRLRERVAGFFQMSSDHQRSFVDGQTPTLRHVDILQEVVETECYEFKDKSIGQLLGYLAGESSDKTEDFVERLTKFHPTCQSCPRIWHQTHGGMTMWSHAASNGVAIDIV